MTKVQLLENVILNFWTKTMFGSDVYHLIAAFLIYSVMGWCVESIYMSFCNHKITNRGFAKGPVCPIYGFGGVVGYLILSPLRGRFMPLYFAGAFLATSFEYLVGVLMLKIFGEIWWDYNEKPFNYRGIICLESTVAWGFYAVFIIQVLNTRIYEFIDRYDPRLVIVCCSLVILAVTVDYILRLKEIAEKNDFSLAEQKERLVEFYHAHRHSE